MDGEGAGKVQLLVGVVECRYGFSVDMWLVLLRPAGENSWRWKCVSNVYGAVLHVAACCWCLY